MKITHVELYEIEIPPIPPIARYFPKIYDITLCRVQTDEGLEGWGEFQGQKAAGEAYLAEKAASDGAKKTESGLIIIESEPGEGDSPKATDTVRVHYHGMLADGTVFDSSVDRGEPTTFPLTGVIPCWTEGVQRIAVGGKSRLVCPPDLAYGPQGRPGIPGNAALMFEVELLEIVEN